MADSDRAVEALRGHFAGALKAGRIQDVYKIDNCAVLTAVGEDMHSSRGISAKVTMLHMHSSRGISTKVTMLSAQAPPSSLMVLPTHLLPFVSSSLPSSPSVF